MTPAFTNLCDRLERTARAMYNFGDESKPASVIFPEAEQQLLLRAFAVDLLAMVADAEEAERPKQPEPDQSGDDDDRYMRFTGGYDYVWDLVYVGAKDGAKIWYASVEGTPWLLRYTDKDGWILINLRSIYVFSARPTRPEAEREVLNSTANQLSAQEDEPS